MEELGSSNNLPLGRVRVFFRNFLQVPLIVHLGIFVGGHTLILYHSYWEDDDAQDRNIKKKGVCVDGTSSFLNGTSSNQMDHFQYSRLFAR